MQPEPAPGINRDEALRRLRVSLEHRQHRADDQIATARRVLDWLRWIGLDRCGWRVHIRDDAIAVFDGRKFHSLEPPRRR